MKRVVEFASSGEYRRTIVYFVQVYNSFDVHFYENGKRIKITACESQQQAERIAVNFVNE